MLSVKLSFVVPVATIALSILLQSGRAAAFRSSPSYRPSCRFLLAMTSSNHDVSPPVARREEDRVVLAGVGPPPRQSESSTNKLLDPPVAVSDPYGWLRDESRTNDRVLQHLKEENAYTEALTSHLEPLRNKLYKEMLSSIQETDFEVPRARGDWWYYTRTFEGKSYTVHCRAPKTTDTVDWDGRADTPILTNEEIVLDVNQLAEGHSYCATGTVKTSPSHKLLAYSIDFKGDETCLLFVKNLATGETVDHDEALEIYGSLVWGADDSTLFYLKMDDTKRPFQVYKRTIGNSDEKDELVWEEPNELYWVHISKSLDNKYLFIDSSSKETSEVHYLDLTDPHATLQCVAKKRPKVLYEVEHRNGKWWISSNVDGTPNMRLMSCPVGPDCERNGNTLSTRMERRCLMEGTTGPCQMSPPLRLMLWRRDVKEAFLVSGSFRFKTRLGRVF